MKGEKIIQIIQNYKYAALVLLAGLALFAFFPTSRSTQSTTAEETQPVETAFDLSALEQQLADTLSQMEGVGDTSVLLTVKEGSRNILAKDEKTSEGGSEVETVIISNGTSQQSTITVQVIPPSFQGALIVCDGGGDAAVRLKVLKAVEALTGLNANQISICAGKE